MITSIIIIIIIIILKTQSLTPLSDFSLHIHSSPFAVSVHTLQSPIYTSSSPSPVPSCYCPADGCAAAAVDVWFHSGKVEMLLRVVRNVLLLWFVGNRVAFGVRNIILRDTGTEVFNPNKAGTAPRKQRKKKKVIHRRELMPTLDV